MKHVNRNNIVVTICLLLCIITVFPRGAFASPDEKIEKERQASCERIRAKEESCHHGETCDLTESAKWHADKFGESIASCFSINAELLIFGVGE